MLNVKVSAISAVLLASNVPPIVVAPLPTVKFLPSATLTLSLKLEVPLTVKLLFKVVAPATDNVPVVIFNGPSSTVIFLANKLVVTVAVDKVVLPDTPRVPPIEVSPVISSIFIAVESTHIPPLACNLPVIVAVVIVASDKPEIFPDVNVAEPSVNLAPSIISVDVIFFELIFPLVIDAVPSVKILPNTAFDAVELVTVIDPALIPANVPVNCSELFVASVIKTKLPALSPTC